MSISLDSVIGQERAKKILTVSFARERTSHAYLFRGPSGVGKKTAAMAFAAYVNCRAAEGGDACGNCPSCRKYASGSHPDFMYIEPQGATVRISQIRELRKDIHFPPFEALFRIILIPDIHLTLRRKEAANSLLKILEEPPERTVFILTGDEAGDILPTIVSRCQVVPFYALNYEMLAGELEKEGVDRDTARTLAAVSEGSMGRARKFAGDDLLSFRRDMVEQMLTLSADQPEAVEAVFKLAEDAAALKEDLDELLDLLSIWIRDVILAGEGMAEKVVSRDMADLLPAAAKRWTMETLMRHNILIDDARRQLQRNCTRTLVCEVLFFGML